MPLKSPPSGLRGLCNKRMGYHLTEATEVPYVCLDEEIQNPLERQVAIYATICAESRGDDNGGEAHVAPNLEEVEPTPQRCCEKLHTELPSDS